MGGHFLFLIFITHQNYSGLYQESCENLCALSLFYVIHMLAGSVVNALASHYCGPGLILGVGT